MVTRLLIDALRRGRGHYAVYGLAGLFWLAPMAAGIDVGGIGMAAISLIAASVLGPMFAVTTTGLREFRHLPVTNRDLWRTTWILATVVPATLLLLTKVAVACLMLLFGGTPKVSSEAIMLSAVYDFAWTGVLLPAFPFLGYASSRLARRGPLGVVVTLLAATALILGCFVAPIAAADALPARVADFTAATGLGLIAALAIAAASLLWTPQRDLMNRLSGRAVPAEAPRRSESRVRLVDRLSGVSRVVVPYLLMAFAVQIVVWPGVAFYGGGADAINGAMSVIALVVTISSAWPPWIRLLKVMPLSLRQINALLVATPFAVWTGYWFLGFAGEALAIGYPPRLTLPFAFGMAGLGVLAGSAEFRFQGSTAPRFMLGFAVAAVIGLVDYGLRAEAGSRVTFLIIGSLTLLAGASLNHQTLLHSTSSSVAYRRPPPPFGTPAS